MELVSQRSISRFDLSESIYGKCKSDSPIYDLLGFKKTEADEVGALKKSIPQKQLDALFESELRLRYGISSSDLAFRLDSVGETSRALSEDVTYQFPISQVKSWDALRKHAAEMLTYANPVKYDYVVRSVRVSNKPKESRAYLMNMYRYDGTYKYACQLCHESCSSIEATQIFDKPEVELDPMNLCLCPNCASKYRTMRTNRTEMDRVKNFILSVRENEVLGSTQVIIHIASEELWFTQTHFAEVQELLRLEQDIKKKENNTSTVPSADDTDTKPGLSIYDQYVGKRIRRPRDGFIGKVKKVDSQYLYVVIEKDSTRKPGEESRIVLKTFIELKAKSVYEII